MVFENCAVLLVVICEEVSRLRKLILGEKVGGPLK